MKLRHVAAVADLIGTVQDIVHKQLDRRKENVEKDAKIKALEEENERLRERLGGE